MTVELRPLGVKCNLACTYCYQEPMREYENKSSKYDIDLMLAEAEKTGEPFSLFGGEALLVPKKDLRKFFARGYELYESNSIQTNGTLIDDEHIEMFKKYNVHVGVSIDGPNELNGLRVARGKNNNTQELTEKTMENLTKLSINQIDTSIIITLHRVNGSKDNIERLTKFIRWLGDIGIKYGNIHLLEVDKTMLDQEKNVLTEEENIEAFLTLAKFFENNRDLHYAPFDEIEKVMLHNDDKSISCIWNHCDPLNTLAVYGIEGDGSLSNCGRTNKEGIDWYKTTENSYERYISLYNTPQEHGGCSGCRFFLLCGGGCPGEGLDNDLRNKTIHCNSKKAILGYYEDLAIKKGITPFSQREDLKELEEIMYSFFMQDSNINLSNILKIKENEEDVI